VKTSPMMLLSVAVTAILVYAYLPLVLFVLCIALLLLAVQRLVVAWRLLSEVRRQNSEFRKERSMATYRDDEPIETPLRKVKA